MPVLDDERVSLHRRALYRYFSKRVPIGEVEDLVQEVLANLHSRQKSAEIENVQGYLFTIASHVLARRHHKNAQLRYADEEVPDQIDPFSPERILIGQQSLTAALEVIRTLPPRTQQVFVLHRFEEMTYARIAAHLGISASAVEKHIMQALKALHDNARGTE
ncbi:RNA polymerase sigma-70 factor (ECF subfamily) [Sphingobium sp. B2D3A]|uniref:RNA polymerase sigma factor n=1 Tax=unclassified Sphingobium TaxID=2611147 RepID=UPI002224179F|nr:MULTISPECIES: sigma-70 family RNA polymerase sigma factor [unclassified Sphingobium]MCW2338024.1 RNA polymerase sigma-70 factor (ECF subfamily) [Sphingobium sp. B2D3A]MCW2384483.1 RNA polymerase sigma-70 factor (ECF subfamily) [Sphingobium sp. B2D3D]